MAAAPELREQLVAMLGQADALIAAARLVLKQATTTRAALDDAGARLRSIVDNIVGEVDHQISVQEPDPAAVLLIVEGLSGSAKRFAPAGNFTAAAPQGGDKPLKLGVAAGENATTLEKFRSDLRALEVETAAKQFALDVIAHRVKTAPALSSCEVQAVTGQIDISPEEPVPLKVGETRQFVIRSTAGIPSVEWVGSVHPKISLEKGLVGDTLLVRVAYSAAVAGISEVALQAATRSVKKQIQIGLDPGAEPQKPAGSAGVAPVVAPDSGVQPPKDVGTPPIKTDVKVKPQPLGGATAPSKTAAPAAAASAGATLSPEQSASAPAALSSAAAGASTPDPSVPRNVLEKRVLANGGAELKLLQNKLGVNRSGVLDPATRAAIRKWKKDHGLPDDDDTLQNPVVTSILAP